MECAAHFVLSRHTGRKSVGKGDMEMSMVEGIKVALFVMGMVFVLLASIYALMRLSSFVIAHLPKK